MELEKKFHCGEERRRSGGRKKKRCDEINDLKPRQCRHSHENSRLDYIQSDTHTHRKREELTVSHALIGRHFLSTAGTTDALREFKTRVVHSPSVLPRWKNRDAFAQNRERYLDWKLFPLKAASCIHAYVRRYERLFSALHSTRSQEMSTSGRRVWPKP